MRKYYLLACICFVLGCCPRECGEECDVDGLSGETHCESNYHPQIWNDGFSYFREINGNKELHFIGFDECFILERIILLNFELGIHKIVPQYSYHGEGSNATAYYISFHPEVNYYDLMEDGFDNWVTIDSMDKDKTVIRGRYNLAFLRADPTSPASHPDRPDTLYYRNGTFTAVEDD